MGASSPLTSRSLVLTGHEQVIIKPDGTIRMHADVDVGGCRAIRGSRRKLMPFPDVAGRRQLNARVYELRGGIKPIDLQARELIRHIRPAPMSERVEPPRLDRHSHI